MTSPVRSRFFTLVLFIATGFIRTARPALGERAQEVGADTYLVAFTLDAHQDLPRLGPLGGRTRFVGRDVVIFETDRFGLAAVRAAGFEITVIDHPVSAAGYVIMEDTDGRGLPASVAAGARAVWRKGELTLYRGLDLDELDDTPGSHDFHLSRLPEALPLASYLSHDPPAPLLAALARSRELLRQPAGTPAVDLEDRLRAHIHELAYNDTTASPRSRYAFRTETRDFAAEYIRQAYIDALGGRGEVSFMSGFRCGPPDSITIAPNVIARLPGHGRGKILVTAHYDATASRTPGWNWMTDIAPGADDNASGVAATIEILRMLAPLHFDFELIAASWACEEILPDALWGSRAYADSAAARGDSIWAVINMDMLAKRPNHTGAPRLDILTNAGSQWIADLLLAAGTPPEWPGSVDKVIHLERPYSDHNSFWDKGYDAVTIDEDVAVRSDTLYYHRISDTETALDMEQASAAVRMVTAAISALANRTEPDLALAAGDVRLTWPGFPIDRYPDAGQAVTITATVRNVGRAMRDPRPVNVDFYTRDADGGERPIGSETVTLDLLLGQEETVVHSWVVPAKVRGQVTIGARRADSPG